MADPAQIDPAAPRRDEEESSGRMSFFDHLVELRKRIINSLMAIGAGMIVGLLASQHFIDYILKPIQTALKANHLPTDILHP